LTGANREYVTHVTRLVDWYVGCWLRRYECDDASNTYVRMSPT
jgi:hypothetical protein